MNIVISSTEKRQILDITDLINEQLTEKNFKKGLCNLFVKHTTVALTTADLDPGTDLDMLDFMQAVSPKLEYRHSHNPQHAPDHILSSIIGPSATIPVEDGCLALGTWQRVIIIELDGPREREITISLIKE